MLLKELVQVQVRVYPLGEVIEHVEQFLDRSFLFELVTCDKKANKSAFELLAPLLVHLLRHVVLTLLLLLLALVAASLLHFNFLI